MLDLSLGQSEEDEDEFICCDSSHAFGDFAQNSHDDQSAHNTSSDTRSSDQRFKGLKLQASADDTTLCSSDDSEVFLEPDLEPGHPSKHETRHTPLRSSSPDVAFLQNTFMYEMADNIQYEMDMSSQSREVEYVSTDNISNTRSSVSEESAWDNSDASRDSCNSIAIKDEVDEEPNEIDEVVDGPGSSRAEEIPDEPIVMQTNFNDLMSLWREKEKSSASKGRY